LGGNIVKANFVQFDDDFAGLGVSGVQRSGDTRGDCLIRCSGSATKF